MSCIKSSRVAEALHQIRRELLCRGLVKEAAHAIGEHRGWPVHRDPILTARRWRSRLEQMLDPESTKRMAVDDLVIVTELLGAPPIDLERIARGQAA